MLQGIAKYPLTYQLLMSIVIVKDLKTPEFKSSLKGSDAKNALLFRDSNESWRYVAGLSWLFLDDDFSK